MGGVSIRDQGSGNHVMTKDIIDQEQAMTRIAVEYIEMPDLKLTAVQARRLWNIPGDVCDRALATLVARGFLIQTRTGAFLRRASGAAIPLSRRPEFCQAGIPSPPELRDRP